MDPLVLVLGPEQTASFQTCGYLQMRRHSHGSFDPRSEGIARHHAALGKANRKTSRKFALLS